MYMVAAIGAGIGTVMYSVVAVGAVIGISLCAMLSWMDWMDGRRQG